MLACAIGHALAARISGCEVKDLSEDNGGLNALREIFDDGPSMILPVDASACTGMVLHMCAAQVTHLSTNRLLLQGCIQSYGLDMQKVPRTENTSNMLTHSMGEAKLNEGFRWMEYHTPSECADHP